MLKQKKVLVLLAVAIFLIGSLIFFWPNINSNSFSINQNPTKLQVITSFYPLYFFTSQITGDKAHVSNLTSSGTEPHDFEPSPKDIAKIQSSDLLIINGAGFEPWADDIGQQLNSPQHKILTTASELANLSHTQEGSVLNDPHVWLDPVLAQSQVALIANKLIELDPQNKSHYQQNAAQLISKLDQLDSSYAQALTNCQLNTIVTSHDAFGYLAKRYNFQTLALQGLNPDEEPSAREMAMVSDQAKKSQIKYIFFETLISPKLAQTIAQEIGAKTLVFNPLEGLTAEEQQNGADYFSVQTQNLSNLKTALECK